MSLANYPCNSSVMDRVDDIGQDGAARHRRRRNRWLAALVGATIYIGSYATLSLCGDYQTTMSGRVRWPSGFAIYDVAKWTPRFVGLEVYRDVNGNLYPLRLNVLGVLYAPLVVLDRAFIHRNIWLFEA